MVRDGTWNFDGETLRIVPGGDRRVHDLRQALGELTVPVTAIAGVALEPGKKGGRLRLRLRDGADPFLVVVGGKLKEDADPYRLTVDRASLGAAEYLVDEVRSALIIEQVAPTPCDTFLISAPAVPLSATAGDGSVSFDGTTIRIEWTEWAESTKKSAGIQEIALTQVLGVEWMPIVGLTNGFLRFRVTGASAVSPKHDPYCTTWGWQGLGGTTSLLAAAVVARLPHPNGQAELDSAAEPALSAAPESDHDALIARLRELGDLHRGGILTDDEFAEAKSAVLRKL